MKPEKEGMPPEKIRALLIENKVKQVDIAKDLGISTGCPGRVIDRHYKSRRVQEAIAQRVKIPFEKMWGKAA